MASSIFSATARMAAEARMLAEVRVTTLPSRTGDDGFTLVEMLVVLAIIGLLFLALPVLLSAGRPGLEAKAAARALAHDLMAARQKAIFENIETDVALNEAAGS